VIYRPHQTETTRALNWVQVGREFSARYLSKFARFFGHSRPRPPKGEKRIHEIGYLIDS
jgi:hypothetical protein